MLRIFFLFIQKLGSSFPWSSDSEANQSSAAKTLGGEGAANEEKPKKQEGAKPVLSNSSPNSTNLEIMPVPGGVQGQNPTQGLVHWMSAVMAEVSFLTFIDSLFQLIVFALILAHDQQLSS